MKSINKSVMKILLFFIFLSFTQKTFSQDSSMLCMFDLIRLQSRYQDSSNLSFNVTFISSEKDSSGSYVADTIYGSYKVKGNKLWSNVDSVVTIQNEQYLLTRYTDDKTLIVQKPDFPFKKIFSKDFLDTAFQQFEVSGMSIHNIGGSQKQLAISFKTESPYLDYDIYYDTTTYLISKLIYKVKENSDYLKITLLFTGYDTTTLLNDSIFSTSPYFIKNGDKLMLTAQYMDYELVEP